MKNGDGKKEQKKYACLPGLNRLHRLDSKLHNQTRSKSMYRNVLVIIIFVIVGVLAISPVIGNFSGKVFGDPKDALVTVWHFWWLQIAHKQEISELNVPLVSAPYGADYSKYPYYPLWNFMNKHLTCAIGEVSAYNIQILWGFILSGLAMYYLVFFFTKNAYASALSGLIFTFSPYHFSHAFEHLGLSNMQWLVFYILGLFKFIKKPSYISAVLCGILFALIGFFDYYYLYFAGIFSGVLFLFYCFYFRATLLLRIAKHGKYIIAGFFTGMVLLLPALFHILKFIIFKSSGNTLIQTDFVRPFGQLFADSARILNYFLPAYFHPFLGWITRPFIDTFLYGYNPPAQTLYLGWTGLLLSFFWIRKWRSPSLALKEYSDNSVFVNKFFLFAFFAFMIFSFPPYLKLGKIFLPFPSFFLYHIFPMFRNYARLGIFVLISVCVLSGFAISFFLKGFSRRRKLCMAILLGILIVFEFLPYPPTRTIDASSVPPVYAWLSAQRGDYIVAEYPIDADERPYLFCQRYHGKRLVNGVILGAESESIRKKIVDLNADKTPGILKFLGVKYLVLHEDKYSNYEGGMILGQIPDLKSNRGYVLAADFGNKKIYEITAKAVDPKNIMENNNSKKGRSADVRNLEDNKFGFSVGDKFSYSIKYLDLVPVLDLYVKVKSAQSERNVLVEADAKAKGILAMLMDVSIQIKSLIDKDSTVPLSYHQSIRTGKDIKVKDVIFDREQMVMMSKDRKVSFNKYTQDPLSAVFYITTFDFNHVRNFDVFINPGKTNYKLQAEVVGQTQIKSFGKKIDCWEVKGEYFSLKGKPKKIASVNMWFNTSKAKLLVRMEVLTKAGFITLERK
ncbi:MAG: DUF3108 domain-containing protein [Candidatus Omnitrophica bacterium]|nr:DUF3108 domain-containing protein [Candidatus Omnitrophota bacterium]